MPACRNAALPAFGKMDPWWLRFGKHRGLRKRVLESSRSKDTIRAVESEFYGRNSEPKDSVDQDTRDRRLHRQLELARCHYNFIRRHTGLRFGREFRTPAMVAGLRDRVCGFRDVFAFA